MLAKSHSGLPASPATIRRRQIWPAIVGLLALMLSAAGWRHARGADDHFVMLQLTNTGAQLLRCHLLFGHWVERDLGEIAPGRVVEIMMMQSAKDGSLYIERADGQRFMMIENIVCGRDGDWMASFDQVDLAPLRANRPSRVIAGCAAPVRSGRVVCAAPEFRP